MKKLPLLLCYLLVVAMAGCRSGVDLNPRTSVTPTVVGDWVWLNSSGGLGGTRFKPADGEEIVLRFGADKQLTILRNNVVLRQGSYTEGIARSIYTSKDAQAISVVQISTVGSGQLPPLAVDGVLITMTASELSIGDNAYDGYGSTYRRK